jgi:hypothetical protein
VAIKSLRLNGETIQVNCNPPQIFGTVDLKTGKLLKFSDLRKKS